MQFRGFLVVLSLLVVISFESVHARWSSALSFGPNFADEANWGYNMGDSASGSIAEPIVQNPQNVGGRVPAKLIADDGVKGAKLNRKNCFFSPVQCSFYFKRSVRSARYL
ncbi:hypothetical protein M3Y94_00776400 [Aphelenchoides besseyi]|nr:hypothetical protein M3Y94_00776400 [Aphelenchoides besseyi]KAI6232314.1 hypothetical protein M3Y95_00473100 [Aphelenchoides besseyi]